MEEELFRNAKFLIIDDEIANIRVLEGSLEQWGCFNVQSSTDARETMPLYESFQPDIILLDLAMPHLDGFQVMEQLATLIPDGTYLPILILTADITPRSRRRALAGGAKDFLNKPFDASELLLRVWNLLEARFLYLELQNQKQQLQESQKRLQELEALQGG